MNAVPASAAGDHFANPRRGTRPVRRADAHPSTPPLRSVAHVLAWALDRGLDTPTKTDQPTWAGIDRLQIALAKRSRWTSTFGPADRFTEGWRQPPIHESAHRPPSRERPKRSR